MASEAIGAEIARATGRIYFADGAASGERWIPCFDDFADELVTGNSKIAHVSVGEFEVGAADSREPNPNEALARRGCGLGIIAA
jgi:hypothetical protein